MTSDSTLLDHWQTRCVRWLMTSGELTVWEGNERIYVGWLDRSVLLCLQLRCEQMASLNSVK